MKHREPSIARKLPCVHLGEPTGEAIVCKACKGVKLKLFACAVHMHCTKGQEVSGVACCVGCGEYSAEPPSD